MVRAVGHAFVVCGVCLSSDCVWACSKGYSFSVWLVVRLVIVAPCGWVRVICLPRVRRRGLAMGRIRVLRLGWVRWHHRGAMRKSLGNSLDMRKSPTPPFSGGGGVILFRVLMFCT